MGLTLPWDGWQGLRTAGVSFAPLSVLGLCALGRWRAAPAAAAVFGLAGVALIIWRLTSAPSPSFWPGARLSHLALALVLAGAAMAAAAGVAALWRPAPVRRLAEPERNALSAAWRATWTSRLVVWAGGLLGALEIKLGIAPPPWTRPLGSFGNLLTAPASAWDAGNYLAIGQVGYLAAPNLRAFFPLYPTLIRAASWSQQSTLIVGIVISLVAFVVALYLLHRLMELELGRRAADLLVLLAAFFPMALFFSAVYTESLFLALSVAAFYSARRGWWARAGICGALAAATRSTGVLLILPLLVFYLYGPREDRGRDGSGEERAPRRTGDDVGGGRYRWRPRYRLTPSVGYLALVPLGLVGYLAYAGAHGDLLGPLHAERTYWFRTFGLGMGAVHGFMDALRSIHQIVAGPGSHALAPVPRGQLSDPMRLAAVDLIDFGFFAFACAAVIGVFRRLPLAYGVYAAVAILVTVSSFPPHEPLESFPRFLLTIFPCLMWFAIWTGERRRRSIVLVLNAGLLAYFAGQFASWHWVA